MANQKLAVGELEIISKYVLEISNIHLDTTKVYLIETRLGPLVNKYGCNSYSGLYRKAKDDSSGNIRKEIIDAITTNETSFFRDKKPFELIKTKLVPDLLADNPRKMIKIWSAAASTGQEVYSICMILKEILFDLSNYNIQITGTDISQNAISIASKGVYSNFEVNRGLLPSQIAKYFTLIRNNEYKIKDELRSIVRFQKGNLFDSRSIIGKFDIILCRNVAIYFQKEKRMLLFDNIAEKLDPSGFLIIGSTESLFGITDRFKRKEYHNAVYYQLFFIFTLCHLPISLLS